MIDHFKFYSYGVIQPILMMEIYEIYRLYLILITSFLILPRLDFN